MDPELETKLAYFKDLELLDISDDETGFPDRGLLDAERLLADTEAKPAISKLTRQRSSFLGPTPKERKAEFERQSRKQRAEARSLAFPLNRAETAPQPEVTSSFPIVEFAAPDRRLRLKRNASLSALPASTDARKDVPFYKQVGNVPRELRNGKGAKPAENIKLEPEHKQLFKGKIIYFFPNNDVDMARRQRIHKIVQLGAAWVNTWRGDITHVFADDPTTTYSQVLKHLNQPGLPRNVVLVKFDPYVPQCIQFNMVLDPSLGRFLVKGAPKPAAPRPSQAEPSRLSSQSSQASLQIKQSRRQQAAQGSQKTDSRPSEGKSSPHVPSSPNIVPASTNDDSNNERVEDSFMSSQPNPEIRAERAKETKTPSTAHGDALSEAIEQMKAVAHLPLDEDEEHCPTNSPSPSAPDQASDYETDDEPRKPSKSSKRSKKPASAPTRSSPRNKGPNKQLAFQCMDPRGSNSAASGNPNARTIEILDGMCKYYDQMQDQWRTLAYRRAIGALRKQRTRICTKEQAEAIPFVGSRLAEKIEEIVLTNCLRRLDSTRDDPTDKTLRLFLGIYGVGLSQAHRWIQAGYRTLEDLVQKAKLTPNQKIGIEHYEDFSTRIPRAEIETHGAYVRNALRKLDPGFEVIIMGSYRRGASDSGDIDLIITKPGTSLATLRTVVFGTLVPQLFASKFLKASLATSRRHDEGSKWHGASCLKSSKIWRRLDLLLVPEEEMGAALIYFTGNDIFNRSIRLLASKKGMRLNQRGLFKDVIRGRNRERITEGTLVEGRSEKKIFEILGVPWRPPTERIC